MSIVQLVTSSPPVPSFDDFMAVYPKRYGVGAARGQWIWALGKTGNDATVLIEGAKRYAAHVLNNAIDYQHVLAPARWLYEEHWLDEYELPKPKVTDPIESRLAFKASQVKKSATHKSCADWVRANVTEDDMITMRRMGLI